MGNESLLEGKRIHRRTFLRALAAGALLAGGGPLLYASTIEPYTVDVVEQKIGITGLGPGLNGLRIVQLSDLHMGAFVSRAQLTHVFELALEQRPDIVLFTGDYLTSDYDGSVTNGLEDIAAALAVLKERVPMFTVLGNHDHHGRETLLREVLQNAGVQELSNAIERFRRGGDLLYIAGVDSIGTGHQKLGQVVRQAPDDAPVILMTHEPDMAEFSAPSGKFALQVSGHSHGGQINLPLVGRLALPWMGVKYPAGLYRVQNMWQYTNRGIGMIYYPIRFNCPPEITVFTLAPA